jgi:NAD(P)-dependent dehydrogenase (short-subunit alcohol dehydrogenase family)
LRLDVTDGESIRAAVDEAIKQFGAIDVLVNILGAAGTGTICRLPRIGINC